MSIREADSTAAAGSSAKMIVCARVLAARDRGHLGPVTRLTLDVEPAYEVRQRVFERLA